MGGVIADWAPVLLLVAALVTSWVTRRNAKDTSALGGFSTLAAELRAELNDAKRDIKSLQDDNRRHANLARIHDRWDWMVVRRLRALDPEVEIPDPPPLD